MGAQLTTKPGKKSASPEMNVTPLVDVVLVLLIIFMVITPLISKQLWLSLPSKEEAKGEADKGLVVVTVDKELKVRINQEPVELSLFEQKLKSILVNRKDRTVFFDAYNDVNFELASKVLDFSRGAGANPIVVAPETLLTK